MQEVQHRTSNVFAAQAKYVSSCQRCIKLSAGCPARSCDVVCVYAWSLIVLHWRTIAMQRSHVATEGERHC